MEWTGFGPVPEICQMFVRGHEFRGQDNGIVPTLMSKRVEMPRNAGKIGPRLSRPRNPGPVPEICIFRGRDLKGLRTYTFVFVKQ